MTLFSGRRTVVAPLVTVALLGAVAACGTADPAGTATSATSSAASTSTGPGTGQAGGGGMQTFTAVDLNTDGENAADANTVEVVPAVTAFLATLDADTKAKVEYEFADNVSRQTWSNFPAAQVPRMGVPLSDLDDTAKAAAMAVVRTMLSDDGYAQVETIQQADDWLKENSASGNESFGSDVDYYIAVYGTPSTSDSFMVQFGGHHLARNYTYKGNTVSITPDFTGTEPKSFTIGSTDVEPMKQKAETLFSVFESLSAEESTKATLSEAIDDILMGPGVDSGVFPETQGVAASELTNAQQQLVLAAIGAWVDDAATGAASSLMTTYEAQLPETTVAFANTDTVDGESSYLRIDGPRVWIELVNTTSRSTPEIHYHGVYRDKNDDYGSTNPSA